MSGRHVATGCRLLSFALLLALLLLHPAITPAGPVSWQPVPANADGQQWWDEGSLRTTRQGTLQVLSRFLPAVEAGDTAVGQLYVMEIDCDLRLYRDTAVNGLPRFGAPWLPAAGDDLTSAVLEAACRAAADRPQPA